MEVGNRESNVIYRTGKRVEGKTNWGKKGSQVGETQERTAKERNKWQHSVTHRHEDAMVSRPLLYMLT